MNIYEEASLALEKRRLQAETSCRLQYDRAMAFPDFAQAERSVREIIPLLSKAEITGDTKQTEVLKKKYDAAVEKRESVMKKLRLSEKDFLPRYFCNLCNDTGTLKDGKTCRCLNKIIYEILEQQSGLPHRNLHAFSECDLNRFSEKDRPEVQKLYEKMQTFALQFPNVKKHNLLFFGPSGSGKTFLVDSIANTLITRGVTVLYTTAFSLNHLFLKYHTTFDGSREIYMNSILGCDVLIIDDLGSEPILKNVTQEYLFSCINERGISGKSNIISTNLKLNEIIDRYGERTASRIYDKGNCLLIAMEFSNLRNTK